MGDGVSDDSIPPPPNPSGAWEIEQRMVAEQCGVLMHSRQYVIQLCDRTVSRTATHRWLFVPSVDMRERDFPAFS